jgi:LysR family glycine cleavage system transcriptional activator
MGELGERFPDLDLRLHACKDAAAFAEDGVDIAIRYGSPGAGSFESLALLQDEFTPLCSPSLKLRRAHDLRGVKLLHVDGYRAPRPAPSWSRWCAIAGITDVDTQAGPRFSDSLHAFQAAMAGQGVVLGSPVIARDALSSGALVRPYGEALAGATYFFLCPASVAAREDVQALRAWFQRQLAAPA